MPKTIRGFDKGQNPEYSAAMHLWYRTCNPKWWYVEISAELCHIKLYHLHNNSMRHILMIPIWKMKKLRHRKFTYINSFNSHTCMHTHTTTNSNSITTTPLLVWLILLTKDLRYRRTHIIWNGVRWRIIIRAGQGLVVVLQVDWDD